MLGRVVSLALFATLACSAAALASDEDPLSNAQEVLERLRPHVEAACGAKFAKAPRVSLLSVTEAEALASKDLAGDVKRRYPTATAGQRATLLRAAANGLVQSAIARYSISSKQIVVVREAFDRQCRALGYDEGDRAHLLAATLAHEAVHALDDERFDLGTFYREAPSAEALRARAMIVEGRAVHFGGLAAAAADVPKAFRDLLPGGPAPRKERTLLLHLTYRLGERFVAALVERGGTGAAERPLREPPGLTHFVCQPSRWPKDAMDPRPAKVFAAADLNAPQPLSELALRARYGCRLEAGATERIFGAYRGGLQQLVDDTNVSVLAFGSESAATEYARASALEAKTVRDGTLVLRAIGGSAKDQIDRLRTALGIANDVR
jgi:hypothetical protein